MTEVRPRIRLPRSASAGDSIVVKTLINHDMESGQRRNSAGETIPRQIINRFTCEFNGRMVLDSALEGAISANPYFEFEALVDQSGDFVFTWYDDNGDVYTATEAFEVS
ncbi:thiosulfate oxidation carrier complex protein SoxZ [Pararhodobacter sp.]|uniref:thiosulfate oxidation carrier complex protein SoxZ n=1 Tax=Pararhodobacter sp. TaxID=2127056 RepID=UPI002AFF761C|nr:thiosulfate oxidation carrier complex protein SoxZ [Pararhodobacter sp.]